MKKQINPTIKAHLIRGAFYLLLLLVACAIPFALAQRNAAKRNVAKPAASSNLAANAHLTPLSNLKPASNPGAGGPQVAPPASGVQRAIPAQLSGVRSAPSLPRTSQVPTASTYTGPRPLRILPQPKLPRVVLYDQYDNAGANATGSQDFETAFDA